MQPLRILHLEDEPHDAELVRLILEQEGIVADIFRVDTAEQFIEKIEQNSSDIIFADYSLPGFDGLTALGLARQKCPHIPFILISGTLGEEVAIESMKQGATDYVLKNKLSRLGPAVKRALREVQDRHERRKAELAKAASDARYRTLIQTATDAIVCIDGRENIIVWNKGAEKMFGYSAEEIIGTPVRKLISQQDYQLKIDPEFKQLLKSGSETIVNSLSEMTAIHKSGKRFPIELSISATKIEDQWQVTTIIRDVTNRKKLEDQLRHAQKMEAIGRLTGGIAHDFNNLLSVIIGYSGLLLHDFDKKDPLRKDVEEILKAGERASRLTDQLLAFSRKQVIKPLILNLNDVVAETGKMLRRVIGEDVEVISKLDPNLGTVKIDPGQMEQVIINLAVNARDAMPEGGKLVIETTNTVIDNTFMREYPESVPGDYVLLAITDDGIGMNIDTQARIFEPFFTTKEREKGTGLGLSTVYGIIKQNNGFIWVYSAPGKGTTFKIYLPRREEIPDKKPAIDIPRNSFNGTETILLVEDDDGVRKLTSELLAKYGYNVLIAEDGKTALKIFRKHGDSIHLLLTDLVMPDMSGTNLAVKLLNSKPEIKVVYFSGYADNAIVHHGVLKSNIEFLQKPFTDLHLVSKVRTVLDKRNE